MSFANETSFENIWCCVKDCKSNNKQNQYTLFSLPNDNERSYLWLKNANRLDLLDESYDLNLRNNLKICEIHFEDNMLINKNKNCLVSNAVPTIFNFAQQNIECSETTLQYSNMENVCIQNEGIIIIGDVVKIDPFFAENENKSTINNMEIISTNDEINPEIPLGCSTNRTSTVISIVKHDTVGPVSGMVSVFLENNLENSEKNYISQVEDESNEKEPNEKMDWKDDDCPDDNSFLLAALRKREKNTNKARKIYTKLITRRKIPKHLAKATLKKSKTEYSPGKNSKHLKEQIADKKFIEFRRKDFYKICRICFSDDIDELVDINNSNCQGKSFTNILENNKNYDSSNNKYISRFICQKCTTNLLQTHNFYTNLQKATTILLDTYKTLTEGSTRKAVRLSNWERPLLKIADCECETYADSIKTQPLNVIETVKIERPDYNEADRCKNDPNDDSYWSDEDYDSLIKIKRENALKYAMNNDNTNDSLNESFGDFVSKFEVISEDDDDSSTDIDPPPRRRRKRKYIRHPLSPTPNRLKIKGKRPRLPKNYNPTEDDLTCPTCKKVLPNRASLGSHQRNVHVTVECEVCGMRLKGASIRWHMRVMHSMVNGVEDREAAAPKKVLCVKCGKWVRAHKYKIHLKTHMVTKPFACDICDYRTSDKHRLIPHKLLHSGEKPHLCATCGEGFHRKDYLKVHVALHTPLDVPITCNTCPHSFGTKFEYHTHRRLIHGYQKVGALPRVRLINGETVQTVQKSNTRSCHICQKVFPRNNKSFYVHMREHIPRPVRCTLCNKQCNSPEALKSHMRTHTGEKPFKCKLCNKAYSQYGHLQSHRATFHENKRAFKCEYCDKAFNLSIGLKEHIRIHTGETLDCEHCGKAFRQRSNFYKHLREVHSIRRRELNREQSAAQSAPDGPSECLTILSNALTE